jgi:hypothetical protein
MPPLSDVLVSRIVPQSPRWCEDPREVEAFLREGPEGRTSGRRDMAKTRTGGWYDFAGALLGIAGALHGFAGLMGLISPSTRPPPRRSWI